NAIGVLAIELRHFLAAYTAVNPGCRSSRSSWAFLAAYTAVNPMNSSADFGPLFLAAYTAVN
ncbi:hypothetical protein V1979_39740, partial [Pseudomonas aeruginosa]